MPPKSTLQEEPLWDARSESTGVSNRVGTEMAPRFGMPVRLDSPECNSRWLNLPQGGQIKNVSSKLRLIFVIFKDNLVNVNKMQLQYLLEILVTLKT